MNPKINKLKEERAKNKEKIDKFTQRNKVIDAEIEKLENAEIIGIVRAINIELSELPELLKRIKERRAAKLFYKVFFIPHYGGFPSVSQYRYSF